MEGNNDFIAKTSGQNQKVGIIASDGITKVRLEYDNISVIDKNLGLYLVTSNNKQGVVNKNGKTIVYQDYDQIGLNNNLVDQNVTNKYILFDAFKVWLIYMPILNCANNLLYFGHGWCRCICHQCRRLLLQSLAMSLIKQVF